MKTTPLFTAAALSVTAAVVISTLGFFGLASRIDWFVGGTTEKIATLVSIYIVLATFFGTFYLLTSLLMFFVEERTAHRKSSSFLAPLIAMQMVFFAILTPTVVQALDLLGHNLKPTLHFFSQPWAHVIGALFLFFFILTVGWLHFVFLYARGWSKWRLIVLFASVVVLPFIIIYFSPAISHAPPIW